MKHFLYSNQWTSLQYLHAFGIRCCILHNKNNLSHIESKHEKILTLTTCFNDNPVYTTCSASHFREEPLMIWGGARAKAGKKTQRLLAQEKKLNG